MKRELKQPSHYAYFPYYPSATPDEYTLLRSLAEKEEGVVKLRLEWIIFYETLGGGNAKYTAGHFGISRKTFHKWYKRFVEGKRQVPSLRDRSRAPIHRRQREITQEQSERIEWLRKKYMKFGKAKLQVKYFEYYGERISTWKIECVIRERNLYPDPVKHKKRYRRKRRRRKDKKLITQLKKEGWEGFLWHVDAIVIWWYGTRRVILTALEEETRLAYARVYPSNTSKHAEDFLHRLRYLVEGEVSIIHHDNGSEFEGFFAKACKNLNIQQIYSRPRTPKDNPRLERFNWTVQDEWLSMSEVGLDDINTANQNLTAWIHHYNTDRPHSSLNNMTPFNYTENLILEHPKVLPMYSARTIH